MISAVGREREEGVCKVREINERLKWLGKSGVISGRIEMPYVSSIFFINFFEVIHRGMSSIKYVLR